MTSDNDKKAAEEWADDNIDACCGTSDIFLSAAKAFLAGCQYKEKLARAEVIAAISKGVRDAMDKADYPDDVSTCIEEYLTKLERGE